MKEIKMSCIKEWHETCAAFAAEYSATFTAVLTEDETRSERPNEKDLRVSGRTKKKICDNEKCHNRKLGSQAVEKR
jgi:hypothetical protein